jgi:hypothetical protein
MRVAKNYRRSWWSAAVRLVQQSLQVAGRAGEIKSHRDYCHTAWVSAARTRADASFGRAVLESSRLDFSEKWGVCQLPIRKRQKIK